jgi:DNA-binding NtrC family response regulator
VRSVVFSPSDPLGPAEFPQPRTATMLLGVSSRREDHALLQWIFHDTNWELREARGYREALTILCNDRMPVIVCECCMPDGNWQDVLGQIVVLPNSPRLIVAACEGNERVGAEVLNLGGYDVLARPFDKTEVLRSVSRAWQNWDGEWSRTSQRWRTLAVGA